SEVAVPIDAILVQDLGLGVRAFVTNNEAYASQYIDHHIARHARCGPVVMSRQNLAQDGKHPWVVHGCLDGASAFATDAMQVFGPGHRDADGIRAAEPSQGANCSPVGGSAAAEPANEAASVGVHYPDRFLEEFSGGRLLSFFTPDPPHNRHVVLLGKERIVTRRHGALLHSGKAMLPDQSTLYATCWMHGVFAAQLTIGNTSFHKLFSVSR